MAELAARVAPAGRIGSHLYDALVAVSEREARTGRNVGETYILGDSPLVLLTALQSSFEPDTTSSRFEILPCPRLTPGGRMSRGRTAARSVSTHGSTFGSWSRTSSRSSLSAPL